MPVTLVRQAPSNTLVSRDASDRLLVLVLSANTPTAIACASTGAPYTVSGCQPTRGMCFGNQDVNTEATACSANKRAITPSPAWDGVGATSQATCCIDNVCTCNNGVGSASVLDTTATGCSSDGAEECAICNAGFFLGRGTLPTLCTACTPVAASASIALDAVDAVLTCTSPTTSRIDACTAGYYKSDDTANLADTCTAWTASCAAEEFIQTVGTGTTDIVCAGCTTIVNAATAADTALNDGAAASYTCVSSTSSRVSACMSGHAKTVGVDAVANAATCTGADDGSGTNTACALNADNSACAVAGADCVYTAATTVASTSDTCTPLPCVTTDTITVKVDNNAINTQAATTVDNIASFLLTISPVADITSGTTGAVPCSGVSSVMNEYSGTVGVTLSCSLGVLTVDAEDCVHYDVCSADEDDCLGLVAGASNDHVCTSTGPATHFCVHTQAILTTK